MAKRKASIAELSSRKVIKKEVLDTGTKAGASQSEPLQLNKMSDRTDESFFDFLGLAPELRLQIYEELLVADEPLRGQAARKNKQYGLSPAILGVNRQIHREALDVFYGKNTFAISADPRGMAEGEGPACFGQMDPSLPQEHWLSLRRLEIDLMYHQSIAKELRHSIDDCWKPIERGCFLYIKNLASLLRTAGPQLRSLKITANVNDHICARRSLIPFFMADRDAEFQKILSRLPVGEIPMHFEFPDSYYHGLVAPTVFQKRSILLMACHIIFCQSQARIDRLLASFENGQDPYPAEHDRIDLAPFVTKKPGRFRAASASQGEAAN